MHSDLSHERSIEDVGTTSGNKAECNKLDGPKSQSVPPVLVQSSQTLNHASKHKWHTRENSISAAYFQLSSPFPTTLHADLYLKPGVLVDESQPSSIIAYTLASSK